MLSAVLMILKILGLVLLGIFAVMIFLITLALFVPVRYRITGFRKNRDEVPVHVQARITWLFSAIRVIASYPEAIYLKVKVFFLPIFRFPEERKQKTEEARKKKEYNQANVRMQDMSAKEEIHEETDQRTRIEKKKAWKTPEKKNILKKIFEKIRYTILGMCAKIKDAVFSVNRYRDILKSREFQSAFSLCSGQLYKIYRHVRPTRVKAKITVGAKDPSATGQIFEIYSMLYPFIGNDILVTPDFEHTVLEGNFYIKGRISMYVLLLAAWKIYQDKNIRKLILLLKREED